MTHLDDFSSNLTCEDAQPRQAWSEPITARLARLYFTMSEPKLRADADAPLPELPELSELTPEPLYGWNGYPIGPCGGGPECAYEEGTWFLCALHQREAAESPAP